MKSTTPPKESPDRSFFKSLTSFFSVGARLKAAQQAADASREETRRILAKADATIVSSRTCINEADVAIAESSRLRAEESQGLRVK